MNNLLSLMINLNQSSKKQKMKSNAKNDKDNKYFNNLSKNNNREKVYKQNIEKK